MAMPHRLPPLKVSTSLLALAVMISGCGTERISNPTFTPGAAATAGRIPSSASSTSGGDPTFLTADSAAPAMANPVIAFWAVKGVNKEVRMVYHA